MTTSEPTDPDAKLQEMLFVPLPQREAIWCEVADAYEELPPQSNFETMRRPSRLAHFLA